MPLVSRVLDIAVATLALLLLLPLLAVTAAAVSITMGSPAIFRQKRLGFLEREFMLFKFRTMSQQTDWAGNLLPDAQRLAGLGKALRKSSIDELPQLWNVLRGEMSLVGPRPLFVHYLPLYNATQRRRHLVKPGITGWAQVHGRNAIGWNEKFEMDIWYVDHKSVWLDLKILAMTVKRVICQENVSAINHVSMTEFSGSEPANHHGA